MKGAIDLNAINAELKKQGRRICPCCGRNLALDEANYYRKKNKKGLWTRWSTDCRNCTKAVVAARAAERYRKDKAYREYKTRYRRAWFALPENRARHRERNRTYMRAKRDEQKRQHFAKLIVKRHEGGFQ